MIFKIRVEFEYNVTQDTYIDTESEALAICEENNVFENYDNIIEIKWKRMEYEEMSEIFPENMNINELEDEENI